MRLCLVSHHTVLVTILFCSRRSYPTGLLGSEPASISTSQTYLPTYLPTQLAETRKNSGIQPTSRTNSTRKITSKPEPIPRIEPSSKLPPFLPPGFLPAQNAPLSQVQRVPRTRLHARDHALPAVPAPRPGVLRRRRRRAVREVRRHGA